MKSKGMLRFQAFLLAALAVCAFISVDFLLNYATGVYSLEQYGEIYSSSLINRYYPVFDFTNWTLGSFLNEFALSMIWTSFFAALNIIVEVFSLLKRSFRKN